MPWLIGAAERMNACLILPTEEEQGPGCAVMRGRWEVRALSLEARLPSITADFLSVCPLGTVVTLHRGSDVEVECRDGGLRP